MHNFSFFSKKRSDLMTFHTEFKNVTRLWIGKRNPSMWKLKGLWFYLCDKQKKLNKCLKDAIFWCRENLDVFDMKKFTQYKKIKILKFF